jgi:hypothetical protein
MAKKSNKPFFTTFEIAAPQLCALPMNNLRFLENISVLQALEDSSFLRRFVCQRCGLGRLGGYTLVGVYYEPNKN